LPAGSVFRPFANVAKEWTESLLFRVVIHDDGERVMMNDEAAAAAAAAADEE
jgi:hypothetical protein